MPQSKIGLLAAAAVFTIGCGGDAVSPPSLVSVPVTWSFCLADAPVWMAFKDGNAAWTRVTPNSATSFSFVLTHDVGAVAYVTEQVSAGTTASFFTVIYGTTAELRVSPSAACTSGAKTVRVPLNSVASGQIALLTLGAASTNAAGSAAFLGNVADRPLDLIATLRVLGHGGSIASAPADKVIVRHGLNVPDGGDAAPVDFAGPEAIAPLTATVNVVDPNPTGCSSATYLIESSLRTPTSSQLLSFVQQPATVASAALRAIPSASLVAGDIHELNVTADDECAPSTDATREALVSARGVDGRTITLGPALGAVAFTVVGGTATTARIRADYPVQAEYAAEWTASYTIRPNASALRSARVTATAGYTGSVRAVLDVPDLSAVPGWQDVWGIPRNAGNSGLFSFVASSAVVLPLTTYPTTPPPQPDGTIIRTSGRLVFLPPPTS